MVSVCSFFVKSASYSTVLFQGQQHKIFTDTYNLMKLENYRFPTLKESEAMFENGDIAPEWRDDKECFRCRQVFTTFIRKVKLEIRFLKRLS